MEFHLDWDLVGCILQRNMTQEQKLLMSLAMTLCGLWWVVGSHVQTTLSILPALTAVIDPNNTTNALGYLSRNIFGTKQTK
jgi:hypothetical protein